MRRSALTEAVDEAGGVLSVPIASGEIGDRTRMENASEFMTDTW
jgi:hypothetical protein